MACRWPVVASLQWGQQLCPVRAPIHASEHQYLTFQTRFRQAHRYETPEPAFVSPASPEWPIQRQSVVVVVVARIPVKPQAPNMAAESSSSSFLNPKRKSNRNVNTPLLFWAKRTGILFLKACRGKQTDSLRCQKGKTMTLTIHPNVISCKSPASTILIQLSAIQQSTLCCSLAVTKCSTAKNSFTFCRLWVQ